MSACGPPWLLWARTHERARPALDAPAITLGFNSGENPLPPQCSIGRGGSNPPRGRRPPLTDPLGGNAFPVLSAQYRTGIWPLCSLLDRRLPIWGVSPTEPFRASVAERRGCAPA